MFWSDGGGGVSSADGEAKSAGLSGAVIGVLPENDDFDLVEGTFVEGAKNLRRRRIDSARGIFAADEFSQLPEIGLFEFTREMLAPAFLDANWSGHFEGRAVSKLLRIWVTASFSFGNSSTTTFQII